MMEIHSRTTVIDGLATHYLEAGHGDPVILLHGEIGRASCRERV